MAASGPEAPVAANLVVSATPSQRWLTAGAAVLAALATAAGVMAWNAQQRVKALETELVKRQSESGEQAAEARLLARQAAEQSRDAAAKLALLEARVAESTLQRSQLEELIQQLARSRDENVLADVDAALRVALQQAALTGSAEPVITTLRQADERLARFNQPRLERVRRAIAQDLDRVRNAAVAEVPQLTLRLDELMRQVDDLPLTNSVEARATAPSERSAGASAGASSGQGRAAGNSPAAARAASAPPGLTERWAEVGAHVWAEVRSLVRVRRIEQPEAMLLAPEQAFFLRENLKLRLLNARLALLSRQFDVAQADLREAQAALTRHFEPGHRRVQFALDTTRQVAAQARQVVVPRPDATLAAIATAAPAASGR